MANHNSVVPTVRILQKMADAGLIKLHADTGKKVGHWTGATTTAYYIDDVCEGVKQPFEFEGWHYRLKYFDGCFMPFVVCLEVAKRVGVDLDAQLMA